jgi:Zn-dependent protease
MNSTTPHALTPRQIENLKTVAEHLSRRAAADAPAPPASGKAAGLRRWGPIGVLLLFVLSKSKWLVMVLKVAKLQTLLTMLLAVWVYAQIWGLSFAAGFVLLIFIHECGHALMMRRLGIPAGAPVFIPFVGAVIAMKGRPRDAHAEALIGLGGPLLGTAGALFCLVLGWSLQSGFWYALAYTGFMLNLFNMIPISPLDGGRIVGVLSRWLWVAGFAVGGVVWYQIRSPLLLLILAIGLFSFFRSWKNPDPDYYKVPARNRVGVGVAYFGALCLMAMGMWLAHQPLQALHGV